MKRVVFLLAVVLLTLPGLAVAQSDAGAAFQAYGEATASYSVGCSVVDAQIYSIDVKSTSVDCGASCVNIATICPSLNDITQCGLNITANDFSVSTTYGTLKQVSAVGSTSATMLGTASICGDPSLFSSDTGFTQVNVATSTATFDGSKIGGPCAAVYGSGSATTTQTFVVKPAVVDGVAPN